MFKNRDSHFSRTLAFSLSACDEKKEVAKTVSNNTKEEQSSAKKKIRRMKIQENIMLKNYSN